MKVLYSGGIKPLKFNGSCTNIAKSFPFLADKVLHIPYQTDELLPSLKKLSIDRIPDLLKRVNQDDGAGFILQIEFQSSNNAEMLYRMLE